MYFIHDIVVHKAHKSSKCYSYVVLLGIINSENPYLHLADTFGPFYEHGLAFNLAWICNDAHYEWGIKLLIHFLTSTVAPLKFRSGN